MFSPESVKPVRSFRKDSASLISPPESRDIKTNSEHDIEQAFPHKIPTPPSSRPTSSRKPHRRSLRGNSKANAKPKISQPALINDIDGDDFNFQKYKLLPAIGSQDSTNNDTEEDVCNDEKVTGSQPDTLVLAVRLLDGSRHQHCFSSIDTFNDVLQHMRSVASQDDAVVKSGHSCEFITCEVPKQIFADLSVSLGEANIKTRTLLYLREIDPD